MNELQFYKKSLRPDRQHSYKAIVKYVHKKIVPDMKSVVDFGCGAGWFLYYFKQRGITNLVGIEPNLSTIFEVADPLILDHLVKGSLTRKIHLETKFDVAFCIEVVEHINKRWSNIICENITMYSDLLIFSAAHPGQGGYGHINEQPFEYWEEKLNKKNFYLNKPTTISFRKHLRKSKVKKWYIDNIAVFERGTDG